MLPFDQRVTFALFAILTLALGAFGFYRLYRRIAGAPRDVDQRTNKPIQRAWYSLKTTLTQERVFRKRFVVSFFHSFIFYAFVLYILVNSVDAIEGYIALPALDLPIARAIYGMLADAFSVLAILGVVALVIRRFASRSRHDFDFPPTTLLHKKVRNGYIKRDSLIVSIFIIFHVASRIVGNSAELAINGPDKWQPFSTSLIPLFAGPHAMAWHIFGYWGAFGSVLLFIVYFPYSKHLHLIMAPIKYFFHREALSGELPALTINLEAADPEIGAILLSDLSWPRVLDSYACIQCNRCQDVCPASRTGKALSPAALEINKRMLLNDSAVTMNFGALVGKKDRKQDTYVGSNLLQAVISAESVWACTTCSACMEVCPTQNEQMLDIIDIRRQQVMLEGAFPPALQSAFRGMERNSNPWGLARDKRMAWAENLDVPTIDDIPDPDVLYWVGCAASYDPGAQKTARAVVQLLAEANVNFAVLGKKESCTGDSARRSGNEMLYQQLAKEAVATLTIVKPKLILASCPHCVNTIEHEYPQFGGNFTVMHHSEYLQKLLSEDKLKPEPGEETITFHDPCYLGRHRGTYDAPREVIRVLSKSYIELERSKSNSFCCGAGGAQFFKEEEAGTERISENRFREVQQTLSGSKDEKVLAVGCPFCKSMLQSSPSAANDKTIVVKDIAEILLEGIQRTRTQIDTPATAVAPMLVMASEKDHADSTQNRPACPISDIAPTTPMHETVASSLEMTQNPIRQKWIPKSKIALPSKQEDVAPGIPHVENNEPNTPTETLPTRKKWQPKKTT